MKRTKIQTISGHRLPEPRITLTAIRLAVLWIGLPILILGGVLDGSADASGPGIQSVGMDIAMALANSPYNRH